MNIIVRYQGMYPRVVCQEPAERRLKLLQKFASIDTARVTFIGQKRGNAARVLQNQERFRKHRPAGHYKTHPQIGLKPENWGISYFAQRELSGNVTPAGI